MRTVLLALRVLSTVFLLALSLACNSSSPAQSPKSGTTSTPRATTGHDLSRDEARGGHTLRKHVGRSDHDLRERLRRERAISAASTYTDRHTAETFIGTCLDDDQVRIQQWLTKDRHPNLALDCMGDPAWPVGRTLNRGQSQP